MYCSKCGRELNAEDFFCVRCGVALKPDQVDLPLTKSSEALQPLPMKTVFERKVARNLIYLMVATVVGTVVFIIAILPKVPVSSETASDAPTVHSDLQASKVDKQQLPAADRAFVTVAMNYLMGVDESGKRMATVWAGASQGTSSLTQCFAATSIALEDEKALYATYRKSRGVVPRPFVPVDQDIVAIHAKVSNGLNRTMSYLANGDLNAIAEGTGQYKDAVLMEVSATNDVEKIMRAEAK